MPVNNLMGLQRQLGMVSDRDLSRAMGMQGLQIPPLFLMMEVSRRRSLRSGPTGPVKPRSMLEEMSQGMYQPVPDPPINLPPVEDMMNSGIMGLAQQQPQQPMQPDVTTPSGMGSTFNVGM